MGDRLFDLINLQPGPVVLSAGCAVGRVAMYMARKGLRVGGIDVVSNHVKWARQELQAHGLEDAITIRLMDYHHLYGLADESFDGVYKIVTLVYFTEPERALWEFFRVL